MIKTTRLYQFAILFFLAVIVIISCNSFLPKNDKNVSDSFISDAGAVTVPVPLPTKATFATELVPMNLFYVREGLDRELTLNTYWHSNTLLLFKRANRFFPTIERILKQNMVPEDFKYIVLIESGLLNVTSPAGAGGYWQFLPETAKEYGLEVSTTVDERLHIEKATQAACRYFLESYKKYGSWTVVAAAFNGGQGRMKRIIKHQATQDFYEMYTNSETGRYIYRILAVKLIFENPESYGFRLKQEDLYPVIPFKSVTVNSDIKSLVSFAKSNGTTYRLLREMNPWLVDTLLTVRPSKSYEIRIASGAFNDYDRLIREQVNNGRK